MVALARLTAAPVSSSPPIYTTLPGALDAETAKDVVRGAHMICPYSNATRNNIDVKLSVTPADGNDYDVTLRQLTAK